MPRNNNKGASKKKFEGAKNGKNTKSRNRNNNGGVDYKSTNVGDNSGNMDKRAGINDIGWYTKYPNVISAAARFPYPYRPGMDVPFGISKATTSATSIPVVAASELNYEVPGVMVMDWVPTVGNSKRATDPASVVAKELYSKVRSKYSGALEADAPDFMTYVMAMDSIYAYIAYLKRMYRVISAFDPENYATPYQVLRAMGLSNTTIENLRVNKTRFYGLINELILQSRKFTVPVGMDIFNRHYWMSDNVYKDSDSPRAQFYMFNVKALFKYEFDTVKERPILKLHHLPQFGGLTDIKDITVDDFYEYGLDMIDRLVAWDDAYTINGYLMRAFEGAEGFIVNEISPDEVITYIPQAEVLMQIENSHTVPFGMAIDFDGNSEVFAITQDVITNSVVSDLSYDFPVSDDYFSTFDTDVLIATGVTSLPPVLNIRSDSPTDVDNIIASRLQGHTTVEVKNGNYHFEVTAGTEIPLTWRTVQGDIVSEEAMLTGLDVQDSVTFEAFSPSVTVDALNQLASMSYVRKAFAMEAFAFHPMVRLCNMRVSSNEAKYNHVYILADVSNITTITRESLKELHKCCLYSELNAFSI